MRKAAICLLGSLCAVGVAIDARSHQYAPTVCAASNCSNPNTLQKNGKAVHWPPGSNITFYIDPTFSPDEQKAIMAAITAWQQTGAFSQISYTSVDPGVPSGNNTVSIRQGIAQDSSGVTSVSSGTPNVSTAPGADPSIATGGDIAFDRNYQTTISFSAPTTQNPNNLGTYTYPSYSAGSANGGDTFLTNAMAHEIGHVLGLDDNHDAKGNVIDYPNPTAMGTYSGTNNNGIPPTQVQGVTISSPPGNGQGVTNCDKTVVLANQIQPPKQTPSSGGPSPKGNGGVVPQDTLPSSGGTGGTGGSTDAPCAQGDAGASDEYDDTCNCFHAWTNCYG